MTLKFEKMELKIMSDIKRKLATIRRIDEILPIEGADKIVVAKIGGWQVVTQKDNYKPGDYCVFFEIDSFLPIDERYEFLRKACYKKFEDGTEGFRIKTIKLRGELSQGLSLPLSEFPEIIQSGKLETLADYTRDYVNTSLTDTDGSLYNDIIDVTELLGVIKYDPPVPPSMSGIMKGNFPSFIPKTDQERIQNCIKNLQSKWKDHVWEATLKLDGSSMTVYHNNGDSGVCSRNLDLIEDDTNTFWKVAKKHKIIETLKENNLNYAIQGELMGPGIQGNREGLSDHDMYVFDVYDIDKGTYLNCRERHCFLDDYFMDLLDCPDINTQVYVDDFTLEDFLTYADRKSMNNEIAEGVVFKSIKDPSISFKVINNLYLLSND